MKNNDKDKTMVTKQYHFVADVSFECEYADIDSALKADVPNSFEKYEVKNIKLVNSLIKKKEKVDEQSLSTATESK